MVIKNVMQVVVKVLVIVVAIYGEYVCMFVNSQCRQTNRIGQRLILHLQFLQLFVRIFKFKYWSVWYEVYYSVVFSMLPNLSDLYLNLDCVLFKQQHQHRNRSVLYFRISMVWFTLLFQTILGFIAIKLITKIKIYI